MNTRWAVDDLPGRLVMQRGYPYVRLAAECDDPNDPCGREMGEALWPEGRPIEWLQQHKTNQRVWTAMWQGHPKIEGDSLFREPSFYDHLPDGPYRTLYGTDLAYTSKTRGDWSVLLTGRLYSDGHLYLTDCLRLQVQADVFTARMAAKVMTAPGPVLWYGSTTERGSAQLIRQTIPSFQFRLATSDKYVRAIPTADKLWNRSRVHVPSQAQWADGFCRRVSDFRGEDGGVDDEIDALAAIGDLAIQFSQTVDTQDLQRRLKGAVRGNLRLVC